MATFGDLHPVVSVALGGLLVAFLALYPALFAVMQSHVCRTFGTNALWLAPAIWVATELLRRYVLSGFPWVLVGYSQASVVPVVQVASVLGVYGLSALVVAVSVGATVVVVGRGRARWAVPACTAAGLLVVAAAGAWRVHEGHLTTTGTPLRVAMVQGNIPQGEKWDAGYAGRILDTYLSLTRDAAAAGATLVVWPESSTPFFFEHDALGNAAIRRVVRETGVSLLFGSDQYEPGPPRQLYNSAFFLAPTGATVGVYRKMHLVPFGEYVPMKRLLSFAGPLVQAVADFAPGTEPVVFSLGPHRVSTAICYEVVYPDLIGQFVSRGSELLTTITNDAWYGRSSAPHQHFWQAVVRAVEQGRYLARSANTGISGIVDPYGRVVTRTLLFNRTVSTGDVRLLTERTIYGRTGDSFAWACVVLNVCAMGAVWWQSRRRRTSL